MKPAAVIILVAGIIAIAGSVFLNQQAGGKAFKENYPASALPAEAKEKLPDSRMIQLAAEARSFIRSSKYNNDHYFLIDLGKPSGKKRFFIYNLAKDSIMNSGMVTHGNCNEYWLNEIRFDNTIGSGCSSLGKYRVGIPYQGKFGLAFKLHGLDETNSNAYKRYVVLHGHECVPDHETEDEICQSLGCPTVSPAFLKELDNLISTSAKPILLWIVE